jgi:signal transduction histidine kinase
MANLLPTRHVGLRARMTLSFALGAAVLSAVLSFITYGLTRENLIQEREDVAEARVIANALTVRQSLGPPDKEFTRWDELLTSLPTPQGSQPVVFHGTEWHAKASTEFGQADIPQPLIDQVNANKAARMRTEIGGEPFLVIGVPIPAVGATYYEGVPLKEIQRALDSLAIALLGAAVVTTLAGGLLGFAVSRRAVAPLTSIGQAAEAIAAGDLKTRLAETGDPDLDMLTRSFNEMVQALEDRVQRDARFASEVSHELRSPLMTLAASVEVLENSRVDLPERAQTALDLMKADIERFQQLVEDLLEISRFDVGAIKLHLEEVLVAEMVIQAVSAAGMGPVPVIYDEDVNEVVVKVDKRRFGRVLANLLDNAKKYAGGATSVQIELAGSTDEGPERVHIAVEDAGHGVPEAERDVIFDRFSRGTEGGNRGADTGVGLGLALVDEHVRLHGGRVWVEDRHDGRAGARFVVELPIVPDEEAGDEDSSPVGEPVEEPA